MLGEVVFQCCKFFPCVFPNFTIELLLQAAHGGGKIVLKGLYSGLAGNLVGVLP